MKKKLVEEMFFEDYNHDKKKIKSLLLGNDGAYDSNDNFISLNEKKINPIIKVKRVLLFYLEIKQD